MEVEKNKNNLSDFMSESKLQELRKIITGLEQEELKNLINFIQDPEAFSNEISTLLPLSIRKMIGNGDITVEDLLPLIEKILKESISKDPQSMADILFPIMMPAIRKAVSEDIKRMLDSLNNTLEKGLSPKRFVWRFKALFSNKSYTEIILSHAYIFRVKQVFLIHSKTGLLLNHVSDDESGMGSQVDMVSSMLSAIKDFVQDSFEVKEKQELNTIQVGNFNIWIEQGPYAIIAVIVEGNVPDYFRITMKESIEAIHVNFSYELENFNGDTSVFESKDRFLRTCMQKEKKEKKKKKPVLIFVIIFILLSMIGYWFYQRIEQKHRFNKFLNEVKDFPGLVITDFGRTSGHYYINGLKDPLATDPLVLFEKYKFDKSSLKIHLLPYVSLNKEIVLKKITKMLRPPETAKIDYKSDTIFVSGQANRDWINMAKNKIKYFTYIDYFNISNLNNNDEIIKCIQNIEQDNFTFKYNIITFNSAQEKRINKIVTNINKIINITSDTDSIPFIIIKSYTSYKGSKIANERIAQNRIDKYFNALTERGVSSEIIKSKVIYIEDADKELPVRSVLFEVDFEKK